jgi:hypothetical protein
MAPALAAMIRWRASAAQLSFRWLQTMTIDAKLGLFAKREITR